MTVKIQTENGQIELSNEVIATVVGGAATDNYGVVGMASRNQIRDNFNEILKKENFTRGVVIRQEDDGVGSGCLHYCRLWYKKFLRFVETYKNK